MNTNATATPTTIEEVKAFQYIYASSYAQAYAQIGEKLAGVGPIASKKIFTEGAKLVYEFYRARNKEQKIYVIF